MPGGLMQLTAFGAQNVLINGNPSMSYFTKLYKRSTNFAMEHFRLDPRSMTDTGLPQAGTRTFRFKVPNYADLLHDCYLCLTLPDIWSPVSLPNATNTASPAYPFEFQWNKNLGFNMIQELAINFNGSTIVTMTGEWMKVLSYLQDDITKRSVIDQMVGNIPELYDPANANGRTNQYPHAIANKTTNTTPAPSIRGRQLQIPLPFWFCKEIGQALPLIAMRLTEVEIVITLTNMYNLFTVKDVQNSSSTRIVGIPGDKYSGIQNFLSYPDFKGIPTNSGLTNWNMDPYIEANYVFLTDTERAHVAANERTFLINQIRYVRNEKQYGLNSALIPMYNLCTRVVALFQRVDRALINDWDNYTNWTTPNYAPIVSGSPSNAVNALYSVYSPLQFLSSGNNFLNNMIQQDILVEGNLVFDGKDRFSTKNVNFFREIQNYKFSKGDTEKLPGIYTYSFALDPDTITQPSGTVNASMFNKTYFQYNLLVPPIQATSATFQASLCVLKESVFKTNPGPGVPVSSTVPRPITNPGATNLAPIPPLVNGADVLTLYSSPTNLDIQFQGYNSMIYVESYNFLKVTNGQANVVFTT